MENRPNELLGFFAAWFPDADLEGLDDLEVVRRYLKTTTDTERSTVTDQLRRMLSQDRLPLDVIAEEAWRKFDTQQECRKWLEMIYRELTLS